MEIDKRIPKDGWAPGPYTQRCVTCDQLFLGDKRATLCADCAYTPLKALAKQLSLTMQCNCDLDNWEPEPSTGHSWVCRIHQAAVIRTGP